MKHYLFLFFFFSAQLFAECQTPSDECVAVDKWQFSLSIGAGVITNPLFDGKNIPLVIIPSVSYYGEQWFFDKNTLGFSFSQSDNLVVSSILQPNRENAFFSRWHSNNIFVDNFIHQGLEFAPDYSADQYTKVQVNVKDVKERKWALDAGMQINWFFGERTQIEGKLLHDVNNVYNGFNGQLFINHVWAHNNKQQSSLSLGVNWLSAKQVDYYYGIDWQDNLPSSLNYQGKSSINPFIKFKTQYRLTKQWSIAASIYREFIASGVYNSPLVEDKTIDTVFLGAVYAF